MLKRIFVFVTVLFLGLVLSVRSPVKADSLSIPFSHVPDLINAFYTIASGGKIEISALIGNFTGVDDFLEGLNNYYSEHYTPDGTIAASKQLQTSLNALALLGSSTINDAGQLVFSANAADLANFMGYDINWINRYNYDNTIVENPDTAYQSYLDIINHSNLDYSNIDFNASINGIRYSYSNTYGTLFCGNGNIQNSNTVVFTQTFQDIIDINIVNYNGAYAYYVSGLSTLTNNWWFNPQGWYSQLANWTKTDNFVTGGNLTAGFGNPGTGSFSSYSYNGTLEQCLIDIANHFVNANIYVNDVLWSYAGDIVLAISLNDSVSVGDTGDITYNTFPIDGVGDNGIDLYNWAQSLYDYVVSNPDGIVSMDTVIEGEWDIVDNDTDDGTITSEDEEDVYKVIHGNLVTNATPTPTPDIGDPPILKIIPPILDLPDEIWPDGGRDTTVLAQMVHATDVAMPDDIMTIIWSTIGLLVVGGLITILHK